MSDTRLRQDMPSTAYSSSEAASDAQRPSLTVCYLPPAPAATASHVTLAAGWDHSLALKPDGTVWGTGWNIGGALGDGTTVDRSVPVRLGGSGHLRGQPLLPRALGA